MSAEANNKRKKASSESKPLTADGDHRKRRRNRTTQSCLNCHTSKRMCDRKRPACARCTQLGLTGLCVYEVDDPSQRLDSQDESSRLLKRVAELEGVIRELKNKPRPKWVSSAEQQPDELCLAQATGDTVDDIYSSPALVAPCFRDPSPSHASSDDLGPLPQLSAFTASPLSTPSPAATPPNESLTPAVEINSCTSQLPSSLDLGTIFTSGPHFQAYEDTLNTQQTYLCQSLAAKHACMQCNCLAESANYTVMLELSLRLRKAAEALAQSPNHQAGGYCTLNQRLVELDALTTNTLSSIDSPRLCMPTYNWSQISHSPVISAPSLYTPAASRLDSWLSGNAMSDPGDDSFMSWEPPRRS